MSSMLFKECQNLTGLIKILSDVISMKELWEVYGLLTDELSIGIVRKMIFKIMNPGDMKAIANLWVEKIPNSSWEGSGILPINSNSIISKAHRKQHENWSIICLPKNRLVWKAN